MSVRNYEFEERDRLRRQKELIKRYGQDVIDKKKKELCSNCKRHEKYCNLIPTIDGCCYHDPITSIVVDEPVDIEDAPFLVKIDEMIQRGTISAIIEPEDIEWEDLK